MERVRNRLIAAVFALTILGPTLLFAAEFVGCKLPPWMTSEIATYLEGDRSHPDTDVSLSLDTFASGRLQKALEEQISNHIPFKSSALLGHSAHERAFITASNALFGWDCAPSYFGSSIVFLPEHDAAMYVPYSANASRMEGIVSFANGVARVAMRYPSKRFVIFVAAGYQTPAVNPAYELVSNPLTAEVGASAIEEVVRAKGANNVFIITDAGEYETLDEYYRGYFKTDHHWNIDGTVTGCNLIAETMGFPPVSVSGYKDIPNYEYSGLFARMGLVPLEEQVRDAELDLSSVKIVTGGGYAADGNDHEAFYQAGDLDKKYSFYALYYNNLGSARLNGPGRDAALLICNSFGGSIERLLALAYERLDRRDDVWPGVKDDGQTLSGEIEEVGADDVFFVGTLVDYSTMNEVLPGYFD